MKSKFLNPVSIFFYITILQSVAANLAHPVTPTLLQNLKLEDYMFGVAFAAMSLAQFIFSPFWGKMINVFSERRIMAFGCFGYSISQFLFMIASNPFDIILARTLAGFFMSGTMVCALTYIIYISNNENRGQNLTIYATITTVSSTFGYLIGGLLGDINIEFSFILQVILLVIVSFLHYSMLVTRENLKPYDASSMLKEANPLKSFVEIRTYLSKLLLILFVVSFVSSLATTAYDQSFNYYIKDIFDFPPSYNGIIKATVGVVSLITNLTLCIWIMKKKFISSSLTFVFLACSFFLFAITQINDITYFLLFNILFFACNSIYLPLLQNLCAKYGNSQSSGTIIGFYNSMKSLGMILGALISGFVYTINPQYPFICASLCFFISTIFTFLYHTKSKD